MSQHSSIDAYRAQCSELRRQLQEATDDRDRWHRQAREQRDQVSKLERALLNIVAQERKVAAAQMARIASIEREMSKMKIDFSRTDHLPPRRVRGRRI